MLGDHEGIFGVEDGFALVHSPPPFPHPETTCDRWPHRDSTHPKLDFTGGTELALPRKASSFFYNSFQASACLFVCFQEGVLVRREPSSWSLMRGEIPLPLLPAGCFAIPYLEPPFASFHVCLVIARWVTAPQRDCVFENQWLMLFEDGGGCGSGGWRGVQHLSCFTYKAKDPSTSYTNSESVRETHWKLVLHRCKWAS